MAQPGYSCVVRKSGVSTNMVQEACQLVAGTTYRITDAARRCIDPRAEFSIRDGTTTLAYSAISSVDFLQGQVTLASAPGGAVTWNANFLPITTASDFIPEVKSFSMSTSANLLDTTVMGGLTSPFTRMRLMGQKDVEVSVETITNQEGLAYLSTLMFNGTPVVTEIFFGLNAIPRFRALCLVESISPGAAVDGLVTSNIAFKLAEATSPSAAQFQGAFSFGTHP